MLSFSTHFLIGFGPVSTTQKLERHIHAFGKDTQTIDGTLFWLSPWDSKTQIITSLLHVMDQNVHVQRHSVKAVVGDTVIWRMIQNVSR